MSEKRERICPVCGRSYTDPPALSRRDNKTDICPECGMREALAAIPPPNGRGGPSTLPGTSGRSRTSRPHTHSRNAPWGVIEGESPPSV